MSKVNNGCLSAENYAISTVLTPIAPSSSLSSNINVNTNLIAESTYSNNNFNSSVSTKETSTNILKLNSISSIEHSISNSSLPLSFDQTFQSKLMIHASSTSNCTSLCAITTSSDTSLKKLLQRTLSTSTNITSSSLPSTSDFSGFKQLLPTTYTTALKHTSFASNYISPSTITSDISPKKKLQRPLSTYANINSSSLAPTCSVSGFKQLLPTTYTTPLDQKYFASSYISSSTITTSDISPKNTLQRPLSTCANINSSSLASTLNNITSVKVINSVNNIDDNLFSAESTPIVSDSKFSLERTYSDNISSSSSSNAATPDAKNICENSSSEVLTPIVSASKCSLNRIFSDNVTSEKHITAINNVGKKLSISKRTFSEISRLSFSPTITIDSNLSPAESSSSTSTTPKKYFNNASANLLSSVATPIISDAKTSLKRRYYTIYSKSCSPWTTPDASPKKCLVPALPISDSPIQPIRHQHPTYLLRIYYLSTYLL
ncbi:hypothetical protein CVS40_3334 [Lucilia cuprina]|nr:hypothetical protein CVS40_3334 [Lucilia cuprina]